MKGLFGTKVSRLHSTLIVIIITTIWLAQPGLASKLLYDIDTSYQDIIDSARHNFPLPTFSGSPPYFVIGGIFSLSFPDETLNPDGYQNVLALQCAVADMNIMGPMRGIPTQWFYQIFNDRSQPPTAMRAAIQLLEAGVSVTVGPTQADASLAVTALANSFNITKLAGIVTIDSLSRADVYGSFFRTVPPDKYTSQVIGNVMIYFNWTLVTPIFTDDALGLSGLAAFSSVAVDLGIRATCGRRISAGGTAGLQESIQCLQSSQSTVVLLWMESPDAFNVISEFWNAGLNGLTFFATALWGDLRDVQIMARGRFPTSYLEGTITVIPSPEDQRIIRDCIMEKKVNGLELPFFDEYLAANLRCLPPDPHDPAIAALPPCPQDFGERGFFPNLNCTCLAGDGLERLDTNYQAAYIYDAALVVFNAVDQIVNNCSAVAAAIEIDICAAGYPITALEMNKIIQITSFEGATGTVAFNGNDPARIAFDITQRRTNGAIVVVGSANAEANITIYDEMLEWKDGKLPVSAIVPEEITFSDPLGWSALIIIVIALLLVTGISAYFYLNRREKVIKKTSPFFSQLILLGVFLCVTSQILWDVTQSTATCVIKVWLLAIGFGLIMGNLLAKTYRIFKIFNNARVTSLVIRDIDLLKFTVGVLLLEILMLSIYCFPSGLPRPKVYQSTSETLLKYIQCAVPSNALQLTGTILLFCVNFILVLGAVIIAFLTRNVDSAFNESLYIAYVVYIYLVVSIVLLPLYYTAGDSHSSQSRKFVLRTVGVLIPMFFTLGALFMPKIHLVLKHKKASRELDEEGRVRAPQPRVVAIDGTTFAETQTQTDPYGGRERAFTATSKSKTTISTIVDDERTVSRSGGPRTSLATLTETTQASALTATSRLPTTLAQSREMPNSGTVGSSDGDYRRLFLSGSSTNKKDK